MGNQQSSAYERANEWRERGRWGITTSGRVYRIVKKYTKEEWEEMFSEVRSLMMRRMLDEGSKILSVEELDIVSYLIVDVELEILPHAISCVNCAPFNTYQEDDYIRIKLKESFENGPINLLFSNHLFNDNSEIVKVEGAWKDSEGNVRDSNGNIISETLALVSGIGETIEGRQRFIAAVEQGRYANNHAWSKQTSWDMPPGWK